MVTVSLNHTISLGAITLPYSFTIYNCYNPKAIRYFVYPNILLTNTSFNH